MMFKDFFLEKRELLSGAAMIHDDIPNFGEYKTVWAVRSGLWSDPTVWSTGQIPLAGDVIGITGFSLTYDLMSEAHLETVSVEDGGSLIFSPSIDTRIILVNLLVLEGGKLEVKPNDAVRAEIVFADGAFPADDPKQYSHGLIALGEVIMHGAIKTTSANSLRLAVEPLAGMTSLTMENAPVGWKVGDRVVLPPTDPVAYKNLTGGPMETEEFTITSINGNVINLDHALVNNHTGGRAVDGTITFLPHLVNLSRNVVLRSENPFGTRGHTMFLHRAKVDIQYSEFKDLGRTIGTQAVSLTQIGRYSIHFHHLYGPENPTNTGYQFSFVGNSVADGNKWGVAIHDSSYGLIKANNVYNMMNAGISTEDGTESYNVIEDNIVVKVGAGFDLSDSFWFAGPLNYIRNNVAASAFDSDYLGYGYHLDPMRSNGGSNDDRRYPLFRGADTNVVGEYELKPWGQLNFLDFTNNEAYSMDKGLSLDHYAGPGLDSEILIKDFKAWGVWDGAALVYGGSSPVTFDGLIVRKVAYFGFFYTSQMGAVTLRNADIQDFDVQDGVKSVGIHSTGGVSPYFKLVVENSYLNNSRNIQIDLGQTAGTGELFNSYWKETVIKNVRFDNPPGEPLHYITLQYQSFGSDPRLPMIPNTVYVYDHNGVAGDNFQLYWKEQSPNAPAIYEGDIPYNDSGFSKYASPEAGLTNQQCLDKYGRAVGGGVSRGTAERNGIFGAYVSGLIEGPVISNLRVTRVSDTESVVEWTTNILSDSKLEYGYSSKYELTRPTWTGPIFDEIRRTNHSLRLTSLSNGGVYHFRVKSRDIYSNERISGDFSFTQGQNVVLIPPATQTNVAPTITVQPTSKTVKVGQSVSFIVQANGSSPLSYQWYKDGVAIPGALSDVYQIGSVSKSNEGNYYVVVTNPYGSVQSFVVRLTVQQKGKPVKLR